MIGIEKTIQKLRPGAKFTLFATSIVDWEHELSPPTWEEVMEQFNKDLEEYRSNGGKVIE